MLQLQVQALEVQFNREGDGFDCTCVNYRCRLDWAESHVCVSMLRFLFFFSFFFFFVSCSRGQRLLFMNSSRTFPTFSSLYQSCGSRALFMNPQIPLFSNFFIKNESHDTIHTFKNYFAIVFSVSVFNFSKNKLNSN